MRMRGCCGRGRLSPRGPHDPPGGFCDPQRGGGGRVMQAWNPGNTPGGYTLIFGPSVARLLDPGEVGMSGSAFARRSGSRTRHSECATEYRKDPRRWTGQRVTSGINSRSLTGNSISAIGIRRISSATKTERRPSNLASTRKRVRKSGGVVEGWPFCIRTFGLLPGSVAQGERRW